MMRRHKRNRGPEEVTLNLAAMLDMAFQLLAFFILTFKPNPVEAEIKLNLPRADDQHIVGPVDPPGPVVHRDELASRTLAITINSAHDGRVASVSVGFDKLFDGPLEAGRLRRLDRRLNDVFAVPGAPFDQVLVRVGKNLHYGELMKVIEVCTRQKLADGTAVNKISFVEVPEN
jgi:biopolymer transport protein ExbD